jgi:hypothetical protein
LTKSAETAENKRVGFFVSAKKYKKMQKSAQECEKTEVSIRESGDWTAEA